ncbi:MAG: choice-of-anchor Q domain-containing protein [Thermoanaerobaculales bacterium]|nr:choice-of-anchor Q domain-containing protein [Thermoanaerobaculales bacterium]
MSRLTAIVWIVVVLSTTTASSLTFDVTTTGDSADGACDHHCSLREAVIAANDAPGPDVINLPQGVYKLTLTGIDEDAGLTGDLDITDQVNIYGVGNGATVLDGGWSDRLIDVRQGAGPVQIASLTIRGGAELEGAGVRSGPDTHLHLAHVACIGNEAVVQGGGVYARGTLLVADSLFAANLSGSLAGAIKAEGPLEVLRSTFDGNRTVNGGGAIITSREMTVAVADSLFTANTGAYGGALSIDRSEAVLTNVTFTGNAAVAGRGGAIATNRGTVALRNCTVADNAAVSDGTGFYGSNDPEISIDNTIVSGPDRFAVCGLPLLSDGHNLATDTSCGLDAAGDIVGADPALRGLRDNTGPTLTLALLAGSPAIDAGGGQSAAADQRGVIRPVGPAPDIGAYEADGDEPPAGLPLTVPVVAHVGGVGGTPWRSDVAITNPGDVGLEVAMRYTPASGTQVDETVEIGPFATVLFDDIVSSVFGSGNGQGSLEVIPPADGPSPVVASRTFAVAGAERLGQGMPALDPFPEGTYYIPGLREDAEFRSNIGIAAGDEDLTVQVDLFRGIDGAVGSTFAQTVPAGTQAQWRLPAMFPALAQAGVPMTARVRIFGPGIAYGSLVDQVSSDAVTLIARPASPAVFVPVVAHNPGMQGTFWRSDLFLYNPNPVEAKVVTEYLPEQQDNQGGGVQGKPVAVPAFGTLTVADVAGWLFGVDDGKGALVVTAAPGVVAASRTYTTTAGGGTYGLGVEALPLHAKTSRTLVLTGIRATGGFRTNIGIVGGERYEGMEISLVDHDGTVLATEYVPLEPRTMFQDSVRRIFPNVNWSAFTVGSVRLGASGQLRAAYSSTVDDSSQDPIFTVAVPVR